MGRVRRTLAVVTGVALVLGACGGGDDAATSEYEVVTPMEGLVTLTYAGELDDPAALGAAVKDRLTPAGIEVRGIDLETPGEVGVVLVDEMQESVAADLLEQQGVLRLRPVLELLPGESPERPLTAPADDRADAEVVLADVDDDGEVVATYRLGPMLFGGGIESARALRNQTGEWDVHLTLLEEAADEFNRAAALCFGEAPECPLAQLAIVVDGQVLSAPSISQPSYERDQIVIAGVGDESDTRKLARVLATGPLPVALTPID